jgi:hypothetical protein
MPKMNIRSKIVLALVITVPHLLIVLVLLYEPSTYRTPSQIPLIEAVPLRGITIDGKLDDWPAQMEEHPILHHKQVYGSTDIDDEDLTISSDLSPHFMVGYAPHDNLIYLGVRVRDDILTVGQLFSQTDGCEVYVDGDHSGERGASFWTGGDHPFPALQYIAVPGIGTYDPEDKSNPAVGLSGDIAKTRTTMAFLREGTITTYEWAIEAFDHYPENPTRLIAGKILGFDVAIADKDAPDENAAWVCWGPYAPKKFRHAHFLGDLILSP